MRILYLLASTVFITSALPATAQTKLKAKTALGNVRKIDLDLIAAIRAQQTPKVISLLNQGANANAFNGRPLEIALEPRNPAVVRELLKKGARVSFDQLIYSMTQWNVTPKDKRVTEILLDSGININHIGRWKSRWFGEGHVTTPLITAVQWSSKNTELTKIILARGANVDVELPDGTTALSRAASNDSFDLAVLLIENGASIAKTKDLLFKRAMVYGDAPLLAALKKRGAIPAKLTFAQFEFNRSTETVKTILAAGGDANEKATNLWKDWTILHTVVRNGELEGVRALLDAGANIDARADYWHDEQSGEGLKRATPAFFTVDEVPKLKLLLSRGANPNAVETHSGFSLLMWGAIFGDKNVEAINTLLSAGAKIDSMDLQGQTALHLAATNDKTESVKALLRAKHTRAFIEARDKEGRTALLRAVAPLAINRDRESPYPSKNYADYVPTADALVRAGANINARDNKGATVLHYAVNAESETTFIPLAYFMHRGFKQLDVQDNAGQTPLYLACKNADIQGALFLAKRGANPNIRTKSGLSARQILAQPFRTPRPQTKDKEELKYFEMMYEPRDKELTLQRQYILQEINKMTTQKEGMKRK